MKHNKQAISKIPLSNDTIHRQMIELLSYNEENMCEKLRDSDFALQFNKTTDICAVAPIHLFHLW